MNMPVLLNASENTCQTELAYGRAGVSIDAWEKASAVLQKMHRPLAYGR